MKMLGNYIFVFLFISINVTFSQKDDCIEIYNEPINAYLKSELKDVFIFDYRLQQDTNKIFLKGVFKDTTSESSISVLHKEDFEKSRRVKLNRKIEFERNSVKYCIVKYDLIDSLNKRYPQIKQFYFKNKKWQLVLGNNNKEIKYIIDVLPISIFWQFYSNNSDKDFTEINELKSLTKEAGILNVFALYNIIINNKAKLSKYLEHESK